MDCLDDNLVTAYVARRVSETERGEIEAHLDACDQCLAITCEVIRSEQGEPVATALTIGAAAPARVDDAQIGRYEIRGLIGQGGMGAVYQAFDPQLERKVALKVVRTAAFADPGIKQRLSREARAMAKIAHANVVTVFDAGELPDGVFIAMELVDGMTLTRWQKIADRGWREVIAMYAAAGRGLAAAHEAGVVHRDFKPDNVLVDKAGRPAVTDFGLAVGGATGVGSGDIGQTQGVTGTPRYMSPEQFASGALDARTDQFSFAVALYEALYRAWPFDGATAVELADAVTRGPRPVPESQVPASIGDALARALRADPAERWPSMPALLDALGTAGKKTNRRWLVAGGVAAIAAAGVATIAMRRHEQTPAAAGAPPVATSGHRVAVIIPPFHNTTGDPRFDDALPSEVADVLYRSAEIDPLAGLELERAEKAASITDAGAFAAARGGVLAQGEIVRDGAGFRVTVRTRDIALERTAPSADRVLAATAELAAELAGKLGAPGDGPIAPMSTSLDAVHEHAQANQLAVAGDFKGAVVLLEQAIGHDPQLTVAHVTLGLVLYTLSEQAKAIAEMELAVKGADRLPERQRLQLLGDYYGTLGKYPEAISAYQRYLARWPGDKRTEINLIATAIDAGDFALAYELAKRTVTEFPDLPVVRANYVLAELATTRLGDAAADGAKMLADLPQPTDFGTAFVALAQVLLGRSNDAAATWAKVATSNPDLADQGRADQAMYEGRVDDARALLDRFISTHKPEEARNGLLMRAELELATDRAAAARDATAAMGSGEPRPDYIAASLAVQAGKTEGAAAAIAMWEANDVLEWRVYAKLLAADVAIVRGDLPAAVAAAREAVRMSPVWIARARLGRALLAASAWPEAEKELAWCVDHRGEAAVFMTPTAAYARGVEQDLAQARKRGQP